MYFIYDCNGVVIGNPKGYRTFRGASQQANGKTKVNNEIWTRFYVRKDKSENCINSIKYVNLYTNLKKE